MKTILKWGTATIVSTKPTLPRLPILISQVEKHTSSFVKTCGRG